MGNGKRLSDGQRGRRDSNEAGDSVALQKCCCLNMAPADLRLSLLLPYLFSSSIYSTCLRLFPPACPTLLFLLALFSLFRVTVSIAFLYSSVFLFLFSSPLLTDSSWPLQQQRKFSHMFLIKASHRSPVGRFSCNITAPSVAFSLQWNRVMVRLTDMDLSLTHYPVLKCWDFITLHMQYPSISSNFNFWKD